MNIIYITEILWFDATHDLISIGEDMRLTYFLLSNTLKSRSVDARCYFIRKDIDAFIYFLEWQYWGSIKVCDS